VDFFIGIPTETVDSYTSAKQSTLQRSLSAVLDVDETEIALFITDADDAINQGSETIGTLNGQLRRLRSNRKLADQLQQTGIAVRVKIESPSVGDDATNDLKNVVGKIDSDDFISHLISTVEVLQSITGPEASIQASEMTYEQNCVETTGSLPCMTGSADLTLGNNGSEMTRTHMTPTRLPLGLNRSPSCRSGLTTRAVTLATLATMVQQRHPCPRRRLQMMVVVIQ